MTTYLLTWNPGKTNWVGFEDCLREVREEGSTVATWSCGQTKRMEIGSRVFMLCQGEVSRGVFGSGRTLEVPYIGTHWEEPTLSALYVEIELDTLFDPFERILPREDIASVIPVETRIRQSGWGLTPEAAERLEMIWQNWLTGWAEEPATFPDEVPEEAISARAFQEGAVREVVINAYERNPQARRECLLIHGAKCAACGFTGAHFYGKAGEGLIHVHHIKPISERGGEYQVNPEKDLIPVCPNCHALIHSARSREPYSIAEVKEFIEAAKATNGQQ